MPEPPGLPGKRGVSFEILNGKDGVLDICEVLPGMIIMLGVSVVAFLALFLMNVIEVVLRSLFA